MEVPSADSVLNLSASDALPRLAALRDGLAVATPPGADIEGAIVVMSIPDCEMDADEWRVVENETYQDKMRRLRRDFENFARLEAASRGRPDSQATSPVPTNT